MGETGWDKDQDRRCLEDSRDKLRDAVEIRELINPLRDEGLLSSEDHQRALRLLGSPEERTREQEVDFLIDCLLRSDEPDLKDRFKKVLKENNHEFVACGIRDIGLAVVLRLLPRAATPKIVTDATMKQLINLWSVPPDRFSEARGALKTQLIEMESVCGLILLYLQDALLENVGQKFAAGTDIAMKCLKWAKNMKDPNKSALLQARSHCVLSAISRNAKQFQKALEHVEEAQQKVSASEMGEIEAEVIFTKGRLLMDRYLESGSQEETHTLISDSIENLKQVGDHLPEEQQTWWPSMHQQAVLNMALCYIRYPGGVKRCMDHVSQQDMEEASRALQRLKSPAMQERMDTRARIHVVRTEGDLLFRQNRYPEAKEKLYEARAMAVENNLNIDVRYVDDRLPHVLQAEREEKRAQANALTRTVSEESLTDTKTDEEILMDMRSQLV